MIVGGGLLALGHHLREELFSCHADHNVRRGILFRSATARNGQGDRQRSDTAPAMRPADFAPLDADRAPVDDLHMNLKIALWLFFRLLRWALWIWLIGYMFYVHTHRATILTTLNQLPLHVELTLYGLSVAAIFAGFFEMMTREWTGLPRPPFGRMPRAADTTQSVAELRR